MTPKHRQLRKPKPRPKPKTRVEFIRRAAMLQGLNMQELAEYLECGAPHLYQTIREAVHGERIRAGLEAMFPDLTEAFPWTRGCLSDPVEPGCAVLCKKHPESECRYRSVLPDPKAS